MEGWFDAIEEENIDLWNGRLNQLNKKVVGKIIKWKTDLIEFYNGRQKSWNGRRNLLDSKIEGQIIWNKKYKSESMELKMVGEVIKN